MKQKKEIAFLIFHLFFYPSTHTAIQVNIPVSIGDLVDKITILQVKLEKITDPQKRINIQYELDILQETLALHVPSSEYLQLLTQELHKVNNSLWDIENATRAKEAQKEFDHDFIALARSVYINNGKRHKLKQEINQLTGSRIIEEKQYTKYEIAM